MSESEITEDRPQKIAPLWHALALLGFIASPTHLGLRAFQFFGLNLRSNLARYAITVGTQWLFVLFIAVGLHIYGLRLWNLVGRTWTRWTYVREDLTAALACVLLVLLGGSIYLLLGSPPLDHRPSTMMPQNMVELLAYIPLSISTGLVEELIFRGYLLQQARAYFGRADFAVCIQALFFSLAHGYDQTFAGFADKFLLGCVFGVLATYKKSLLPAVVAHSVLDLLAGLVGFL